MQNPGIIKATPTGTRYGAALGGGVPSLGVQMTGTKRWGGSTPQCPKCGKSVYFAEQVRMLAFQSWDLEGSVKLINVFCGHS